MSRADLALPRATDTIDAMERCKLPARLSGLILLAVVAVAFSAPALATQIEVPVEIDYLVLDAALKQRFYTGAGGRAEFWQGPANCGHLYATDPHFGQAESYVRLVSAADVQAALALAGQCLNAMTWTGKLSADMAPHIENFDLKFRIVDVEFINSNVSVIGGDAFGLVKGQLLGQLGNFSYSLRPYVDRLQKILDSAPSTEVATEVRPILASLKLDQQVTAADHGVTLSLQMTLPQNLLEPMTSQRMTEDEKAAWRSAASEIEDFLKDVATQIQPLIVDPQLTSEVTGIINESRARIAAMANTPPPDGDPLPLLRDEWQRLRSVIRTAAYRQVFGAQSVEMLEAISVGDVIFAIDQKAPALGSRIALAGLRELARGTASRSSEQPTPAP